MASEKEASEESALEETALEETVVGLLKKKENDTVSCRVLYRRCGSSGHRKCAGSFGGIYVWLCHIYKPRQKKMSWSKEEYTEERRCCLSQMCQTDGKRRCESSQNRCLSLCDRACRSGRWNRGDTGGNRIYGMLLCRKDNCEGISFRR